MARHRKGFVYQERLFKGWCGPAVLAMGLAAVGKTVTQEELAKVAPYDPDWGTDHAAMLNGARKFVAKSYEFVGGTLEELAVIAKREVVILNFVDGNSEDGHYVLLDSITELELNVVDPNPISTVDGGYRKINRQWFLRHFWDIGRDGVVKRWALVIPVD